jgi:hypothetical protein
MYTNGSLRDNNFQITNQWDIIKVSLNRSGDRYRKGYIDMLKIYNINLTEMEINTIYGIFKTNTGNELRRWMNLRGVRCGSGSA